MEEIKPSVYYFSLYMFNALKIDEDKAKIITESLNQILEENKVVPRVVYKKGFLNDNFFFNFTDDKDISDDILIQVANNFFSYQLPITTGQYNFNVSQNTLKITTDGDFYKLVKNDGMCRLI